MNIPSSTDLHDRIDEWLALAEADALAPEEQSGLQQALDLHLAACPACRQIAAAHHAMSTHLKTTLETHRPDDALEDRLLSHFREEAAEMEENAPTQGRRTLPMLAAGIARAFTLPSFRYGGALAGIAALVVTGAMLTHEPLPGPVSPESRELKKKIEDQAVYIETKKSGMVLSGYAGDSQDAFDLNAVKTTRAVGSLQRFAASDAAPRPVAAPLPSSSAAKMAAFASAPTAASAALAAPAAPADDAKKLIRRGFVEMVVPAFDKAVAGIEAAAKESGGFLDTQSQSRGPNGKISGSLVVKVLPDNLDAFLAKAALLGEVKNRNTGAEDISKAYADTTARLANARVMEGRLVKMLADKDGKVNELLQVERELGRVRADIETMEAQLRLDDSQVRYATVTFQLRERDLSQDQADRAVLTLALLAPNGDVPAAVETARKTLAAAAPDAEILSARLEQENAGEARAASATLTLRAPSSEADAAERALRALGTVTSSTRTEEGTDANAPVRFEVRLVAEVDPVGHTTLDLQVPAAAVEAKAAAMQAEAAALGATVKDSGFSRLNDGTAVATLRLRVPLERYPALLARLKAEGKTLGFTETRRDATGTEQGPGTATAEISLTYQSEPAIVSDANGPWAVLRQTLAQGAAAFGWSLRMIGVALAFLAPWLGAAAVVGGIVCVVRRRKR